jgi:hypothetical protein
MTLKTGSKNEKRRIENMKLLENSEFCNLNFEIIDAGVRK